MLDWLTAPYAGRPLALCKSVYRYFTLYSFRVSARVRHVAGADGILASYLSKRLLSKHGISFAASASVGYNLRLKHPLGVIVGNEVEIGNNVLLYQHTTIASSRTDIPTHIGDDVIIYANAIVLGGIRIGDRAVIGAGSIVTRDIPPDAIVAGNPARILRYRDKRDEGLF